MVIGCLGAGTLIDAYGRKVGHIVIAIISTVSWITQGLAPNNTVLLIGRFIAGVSVGSNRPITLVYVGEITNPKYRSLSLICPSFSVTLGILVTHILGGYVLWRTSCYIFTAINLVSLFLLLLLKESPLWLISKGRIAEGIAAFEWFRGKDLEAEKELKLVLDRQNEKSKQFILKDVLTLDLVKPFFTMLFLCITIQFNGSNVFNFYAQDIIKSTFKGEIDSFIAMIILDNVRLATLFAVFVLNKFVPRKIFFQFNSFGCCVALFSLSAFLMYINIAKYAWLSITIVILYISLGGGVVGLAWSYVPELFPANLRGVSSGVAASISYFSLFIIVKITPSFMANFGEAAMFLFYGVTLAVNSIILSFMLPETNGRTLQEIEDSYKKNKVIVSAL